MSEKDLDIRIIDLKQNKKDSIELMEKVYGKENEVANSKFYDWQYLENPIGKAQVVGMFNSERKMISQVASIPTSLSVCNKIETHSMTLNIATDPDYRGQNLVSLLFKFMHKEVFKSTFTFGMPNSNSIKLHKRLGYDELKIPLLFKILKLTGFFHINKLSSLDKIIFRPQKKALDKVTIVSNFFKYKTLTQPHSRIFQNRDCAYLNWRYDEIPTRNYYKISHKDNPSSYLIARHTTINEKKITVICELEVANVSQTKDLINALYYEAVKSNNSEIIIAGFFKKSIPYNFLKSAGFIQLPDRLKPHPLALCVKKLATINNLDIIDRKNWFFSLGDFDVF